MPSAAQVLCVLLFGLASACQSPEVNNCEQRVCPLGTICTPAGDTCVLPDQVSSCENRTEGDSCSYTGVLEGICINQACYPAGCGNGTIEPGEVCDDSNRDNGDGCSADCESDETCGNGIIDQAQGETCDGGEQCRDNCTSLLCGDGIIDEAAFEACDDGSANSNAPDAACRLNCRPQRCGDGILDTGIGEECDDGNFVPGDGCRGNCIAEVCGNNLIDLQATPLGFLPAEGCDDGANGLNHDGCAALCVAEAPVWSDALSPRIPLERRSHAMAYDAARGRTILFGGSRGELLADTWEWNGNIWRDVTPSLTSPARRMNHHMSYDAKRGRVVLFGGTGGAGLLGDTWEWNGSRWANLTPLGPRPAPRENHKMAYDSARGRVVLFGGSGASGKLDDTWEWDGAQWTELQPVQSPPARAGHALSYDPVRGRVVLFGGSGSSASVADTWEWDGSTWMSISVAGPSARAGHAMTFDASRGRSILYGGFTSGVVGDSWEWDGVTWLEVAPSGTPPEGRSGHTMAYDIARSTVVLHGGFSDDFEAQAHTWNRIGTDWTNVSPIYTPASPPARVAHRLAYDNARDRTILFGGSTSASPKHRDTWEWDGDSWTDLTPPEPSDSPTGRSDHGMVFDSARGRALLFGGLASGATRLGDTWQWDGSAWTDITPAGSSPEVRSGHAMTYDAARDRVVLFGGTGAGLVRLSDTWEWDGLEWLQTTPLSPSPSARSAHSMTYDPIRQRVVLFGGSASGGSSQETWEWDGSTWTNVSPSGVSPQPRYGHTMTFDPNRSRVLLFAGESSGLVNDLWEWDGSSWQLVAVDVPRPSERTGSTMVYEAPRRQALVLSGFEAGALLDDSWIFQYTAGVDENCTTGFDGDSDGLVGCSDPDCWSHCTPSCPPGAQCDANAPRCGDGLCNTALENSRSCSPDCGPAAVLCGDLHCDTGESIASCPGDCTP